MYGVFLGFNGAFCDFRRQPPLVGLHINTKPSLQQLFFVAHPTVIQDNCNLDLEPGNFQVINLNNSVSTANSFRK